MDILDFDKRLAAFVAYFAAELELPIEIVWGAVLARSSDQVKTVHKQWERDREDARARHQE